MSRGKISLVKEILISLILFLSGLSSVIFSELYFDSVNRGFIFENKDLFLNLTVAIISVITILSLVFYRLKKDFVYKFFLLTVILYATIITSLFILKKSGFIDKITTVEDFRNYISNFGNFAVIVFIILQFLQVVILPIPAFITVGAGVLLFGPLKGAIYSLIGIISGSILAFIIGRSLGYRVVKWLIGKNNLDKGLKLIQGKDRLLLTFMFVFPFFPDDVLCFVAGITTISKKYFIFMIIITRIISVFASCYSLNNSLIPYNTWWGILLWILFVLITVLLTYLILKHGEKLENTILKKIDKT